MRERLGTIPAFFLVMGFLAGTVASYLYFSHPAGECDQGARALPRALKSRGASAPSLLNDKEAILQQLISDLAPINGSSIYNIGIYRYYSRIISEYLGRDAKVAMLEIGPGINLGTGLAFAMAGARKYYGLDIYRDPNLLAAPQYENIAQLLLKVAPDLIKTPAGSIMKVANGQVSFEKEKVEYLYPHQSYDIPLPDGSMDIVFSHATLEHVADPLRTADAIQRVLRKGGITAHLIDLRDHRDFSKPLEFLKFDADTWKSRYKDPSIAHSYMNRWRASEFKAAFEKNGFQILKIQPSKTYPVTEEMRRSLHPDFQNMDCEDLSTTIVLIVARRR